MRRTRTTLVLATVAALALSGCRSDDDPPTDDRADEQVDGDVDADGGSAAGQPGEVTIGQTETHPNGVDVTVRALRVERNAIFVDIEAFNGAQDDVMLAMFRTVVIDDAGHEYHFEPPEDNQELSIDSGGTLEGSLAFIGRVGADASSVTLQFNYNADGTPRQPADHQNARLAGAPSFEFTDLPLPGSEA